MTPPTVDARARPPRGARLAVVVAAPALLAACSRGHDAASVRTIESPARAPSRAPNVCAGPDGGVVLSWVEEGPDTRPAARLRCARFDGVRFSDPREVAAGDDWFVNWADFPAIVDLGDGDLLASFLQRVGEGTYAYHVRVTRSADGGATWGAPVTLHDDRSASEHGFVSLVRDGADAVAVWLDGHATDGHGAGDMALRTRRIGADGSVGAEVELDDRVCDCCQTDAALLDDGTLLVAYRDRSPEEVRDISLVALAPGGEPRPLWGSGDGWEILGCPVNGPALAARGDTVAIAWFTMGSNGVPSVSVALSRDRGRTFSRALLSSVTTAGRVDLALDPRGNPAVVSLEDEGPEGRWVLARLGPSLEVVGRVALDDVAASRGSGFARLAFHGDACLVAFTEDGNAPRVGVRAIRWP